MKYIITYLTVRPVKENKRVGFWFNESSIPEKYKATDIVEYDGEIFDDGWNELVTKDVIDWKMVP